MESGEPYLNNYMFYKNKEKLQTGKTPTRISTLGAGKAITKYEERSDETPHNHTVFYLFIALFSFSSL